MKQAWIKAMVGKLAATGAMLLFLLLVPAAAAGSLPVWAALLLGGAGIVPHFDLYSFCYLLGFLQIVLSLLFTPFLFEL